MSDLVGNPEDRFSHDEAQILTTESRLHVIDCGHSLEEISRTMKKNVVGLLFKRCVYMV